MALVESLWVALSTYSIFPTPQIVWNDRNLKYAICFFPAVGILCGCALWGWYSLACAKGFPSALFAAAATCLPLLITGGIHMDGFMDTVDALTSHRSREEKLSILKDPHCGAFAVIHCCMYLLFSFGLYYTLYEMKAIPVLFPAFVFSRAISAICAVNLPSARREGMLISYTKNTDRYKATFTMTAILILCTALMLFLSFRSGLCLLLLTGMASFAYRSMTLQQFGGVTGDTTGFLLQICELSCLLGAWIGGCL